MTWKTPVLLSYPNVCAHGCSGLGEGRGKRVMMSAQAFFKGHGPEQKLCMKT